MDFTRRAFSPKSPVFSESQKGNPKRMDFDKENDENCGHFFEEVLKICQESRKETKNCLPRTISPLSNRKVLAEMNDSVIFDCPGTPYGEKPHVEKKVLSNVPDQQFEPQMGSSKVCLCGDRGKLGFDTVDSTCYDPMINYTTPRPQFLRYNPNKWREIMRRVEGEMEESEGSQGSSVSFSSSSVFSHQKEVKESEEEDTGVSRKEQMKERRPLCFRVAWKLMLLTGLLLFLSCCIYMKSSFPPMEKSEHDVGMSLKVPKETIGCQEYNRGMFTGNRMGILLGLSDMCLDVRRREVTCGIYDGSKNDVVFSYDCEDIKESEQDLIQHQGVELVKNHQGSIMTKEENLDILADESINIMVNVSFINDEIPEVTSFRESELKKRGQIAGSSSVEMNGTNYVMTGSFQHSTKSIDHHQSIAADNISRIKNLAECILSSEPQMASSMISQYEMKEKFTVPDNSKTLSKWGHVFNLSLNDIFKLLVLPVFIFIIYVIRSLHKFLHKHQNMSASAEDADSLSPPSDLTIEEFRTMVLKKKQMKKRHSYTGISHEPNNHSTGEANRISGIRPPVVELLGEISVVDTTDSATSSSHKTSITEVRRKSTRKENVSSVDKLYAISSEISIAQDSPSNGTPVQKTQIDEDYEDKEGKIKKIDTVATPTPLRRSSRIRNRITSPSN